MTAAGRSRSNAEEHIPSNDGGAGRDRTDDLKLAKLALSQLSYGPDLTIGSVNPGRPFWKEVVGPVRFELTTPRLSSVCSNQLSYEPDLGLASFEEGMRRRRNATSSYVKSRYKSV